MTGRDINWNCPDYTQTSNYPTIVGMNILFQYLFISILCFAKHFDYQLTNVLRNMELVFTVFNFF